MKVFGIAGTSGSGKTTLTEALIRRFTEDGVRVAAVKHTHHGFDLDTPGKDSYRMREAGSTDVVLVSESRLVLMREYRAAPEPELPDVLALLSPCDLVLVEGYKRSAVPKLEVYRPSRGKSPLWPEFPDVVAVASDEPLTTPLPQLDLNDVDAIYAFIRDYLTRSPEITVPQR